MTTLLATPLGGPVSLRVPFAPASAASVRHALEGWLGHHRVADHVVQDARLILSELIGNAIRHASPLSEDTVLVRWRIDQDLLLLSVSDGGGPSAPQLVTAATDDVGGRGLAIVEALSAAWWVERSHRMHAVHVRIALA